MQNIYHAGTSDPVCGSLCWFSKGSSCKDRGHRCRCYHVTWWVERLSLLVFASGIGCLILHHCIKSSCQSWQRIADKKNDSGSPAKLYCLAYGFPKPTVTWWKGTTMLPLSSDRHRQEEFTLSLRWNTTNVTNAIKHFQIGCTAWLGSLHMSSL